MLMQLCSLRNLTRMCLHVAVRDVEKREKGKRRASIIRRAGDVGIEMGGG
jgi:hypothetical protein